jgi:hypothetical protein
VKFQRIARDRFASAGLEDKMANIFADIGKGSIRELGQVNATTGTDKINLERKGVDSRNNFQPYAKHWYCTNDLPRLDTAVGEGKDDSVGAWEIMAFFERFSLVEYPQVFSDEPRQGSGEKLKDRDILRRLTTEAELSGLLNKVLNRMPQVARYGPRKGMNAKESMMLYLRNSNPVQAFIADACFEFDRNYESSKEAVRAAIHHYASVHESPVKVSDAMIKSALTLHGITANYDAKGVKNRLHWWVGVKLSTEWVKAGEDSDKSDEILGTIETGVRLISERPAPENSPRGEDDGRDVAQCTPSPEPSPANSPSLPHPESEHVSNVPPGLSHIDAIQNKDERGPSDVLDSSGDVTQSPGGTGLASRKEGGCDLGDDPEGNTLGDSPAREHQTSPTITNGKLDALMLEQTVWAERRLRALLVNDVPFLDALIEDCVGVLDRGGEGDLKNWGSRDVRMNAGRMPMPPSDVIREMVANDTAAGGYISTIRMIARARILRAHLGKQGGAA